MTAGPERRRSPGGARAERVSLAVQYATAAAGLPGPRRLRRWADAALTRRAEITLRFVGRREGRELNRRFRGRDYATNVLTFVYPERRPLAGDIALCAPVVAREARAQGKRLDAHYAHLVVHGVLHLQGHDHERDDEAQRMERLETRIVRGLGFRDPYGDAPARGGVRHD